MNENAANLSDVPYCWDSPYGIKNVIVDMLNGSVEVPHDGNGTSFLNYSNLTMVPCDFVSRPYNESRLAPILTRFFGTCAPCVWRRVCALRGALHVKVMRVCSTFINAFHHA